MSMENFAEQDEDAGILTYFEDGNAVILGFTRQMLNGVIRR